MKTVDMTREFVYVPASDHRVSMLYKAGSRYERVLDAAAAAIINAGAGSIEAENIEPELRRGRRKSS